MRAFVSLCLALEASSRPEAQDEALRRYFRCVAPHDAAWAAHLLSGHPLRRRIKRADLRAAALASAHLPDWLFAAANETVGDVAETAALIIADGCTDDAGLAVWIEERLDVLAGLSSSECRMRLAKLWSRLDRPARLIVNKLLLGTFRAPASQDVVHRALAEVAGIAPREVASRLRSATPPSSMFWELLRAPDATIAEAIAAPCGLVVARPLRGAPTNLGPRASWQAEWDFRGVRVELATGATGCTLWSSAGDRVTDDFPELASAASSIAPGTVLDGIVVMENATTTSSDVCRDTHAVMLAFDVLALEGQDVRGRPLRERRATLERIVGDSPRLRPTPILPATSWDDLDRMRGDCRRFGARGVILKDLDASYDEAGPCTWWVWKAELYRVQAVLVYAAPGRGLHGSVYAEYTFAVQHHGEFVTFGSASSGLSAAETRAIDAWIRSHTLEKFGPVRRVEPTEVFEVAFDSIAASARHKSGLVVRGVRIVRRRQDVSAAAADTLGTLRAMLAQADLDHRSR